MAIKNPIFKILRCPGCGKQNYHAELLTPIPPCPRCSGSPKYSADWYIKVIVDGKRHIQAIGRQKQHAESALKKAEAEIFYDAYQINQESPLLADAITTLYNARWKKNSDGEGTRAQAERLTAFIGNVPINTIGKKHVATLEQILKERGCKAGTNIKYKTVLKSILNYHDLSIKFIEMEATPQGRIRIISDQEEVECLKIITEKAKTATGRYAFYKEMYDFCVCLCDTGARPGELLKVPPSDINLDTNMITIWVNKTENPRSFPMTKRVREIIEKRKKTGSARLFNLTKDQSDNAWEWVRKKMGLEHDTDFVLYAWRHTSVTRQLIAGIDIVRVQKWHGHKQISTTMKYTHLTPHDLAPSLKILQSRKPSTRRQQSV